MAFDEESLNLARHFYDASDLPAKELATHDIGLEEPEVLRRQLAAREKRRARDIESLAEHIQESIESWFMFHESGQETNDEKTEAAPEAQEVANAGG